MLEKNSLMLNINARMEISLTVLLTEDPNHVDAVAKHV